LTDNNPFNNLLREIVLAVAMIAFLVLGLWAHTGTMPPLVVVESSSMIHEENGEIGSIDAGDLILVMDTPYDNIITFAEASDRENKYYGYGTHGMEGDVIIYQKNGDEGTPIIHRAILRVEPSQTTSPNRMAANVSDYCSEGGTWDSAVIDEDGGVGTCVLTWSVPGTNVTDSESITIRFDGYSAGYYDCNRMAHANVEPYLVVWNWQPKHSGIVTLGDNNQCSVDQGGLVVNGSSGIHSASGVAGPVRESWLVGVAGGEIPWLGTVKLMLSGPSSPGTQYVPGSSFLFLAMVIGGIIFAPVGLEVTLKKIMQNSPEMQQAKLEGDYSSEE